MKCVRTGMLQAAAMLLTTCLWGAQALAGQVIQKPEFTFTLPDGWVEIPQDVMDKASEGMRRMAPNLPTPMPKYGFQLRASKGVAQKDRASDGLIEFPYILVTVSNGGRPPLGVLRGMSSVDLKQEADKHKGELPAFISDLSYEAPVYDESANIVWVVNQQVIPVAGKIGCVTGNIPTQKGLVQFVALATEATWTSRLPEFRQAIMSVKIPPDLVYQPESELLSRAERGDVAAQLALGDMYARGRNAENQAEAAKWYLKAAEQGNARAQAALWDAYYWGRGVAQDRVEALKWLSKSADQGYGLAQYELGLAYASGDGVTQDKEEALKWYGKAADQGVLWAAEALWKGQPREAEMHAKLHRLGSADARKKLAAEWVVGLDDYTKRMPLNRALETGTLGPAFRFNPDGTAQAHPPCDTKIAGMGAVSKTTVLVSGTWHVDDDGVLAFSLTASGHSRAFELRGIPEFYQFDGGIETMVLRGQDHSVKKLGRLDETVVKCE